LYVFFSFLFLPSHFSILLCFLLYSLARIRLWRLWTAANTKLASISYSEPRESNSIPSNGCDSCANASAFFPLPIPVLFAFVFLSFFFLCYRRHISIATVALVMTSAHAEVSTKPRPRLCCSPNPTVYSKLFDKMHNSASVFVTGTVPVDRRWPDCDLGWRGIGGACKLQTEMVTGKCRTKYVMLCILLRNLIVGIIEYWAKCLQWCHIYSAAYTSVLPILVSNSKQQ
jgi:hypothetical protein